MKNIMKGLIIISTPKTKTELLQILRENGYDRISGDQLDRLLSLLNKEKKAEAEIHRLNRTESRKKTKSKAERALRTHQLCNIGGAVVSFYPELVYLSQEELYNLFDKVFHYDAGIDMVINYAITHRKALKGSDDSG